MAMKKNFQKPQARVYEVVEEEGILLGASIEIPDNDPIEDESNIGFSREENTQNSIWNN